MRLYTRTFNKKKEAVAFINDAGIQKADILSFFPEEDGTYTLMYYAE